MMDASQFLHAALLMCWAGLALYCLGALVLDAGGQP